MKQLAMSAVLTLIFAVALPAQVKVSGEPRVDTAAKEKPTSQKRIPIGAAACARLGKDGCLKRDTVTKYDTVTKEVRVPGQVQTITRTVTVTDKSCGNFISCHKVLTGIGATVGTALLGIWMNRQGWFKSGKDEVNVSNVITVGRNRAAVGWRIPIGSF